MSRRTLRRPCPECGRNVNVHSITETIRRHGPEGNPCPGSGRRIDLYGERRTNA